MDDVWREELESQASALQEQSEIFVDLTLLKPHQRVRTNSFSLGFCKDDVPVAMPFFPNRNILIVSASTLCLLTLWYLLTDLTAPPTGMGSTEESGWRFEAVKGFFAQGEPESDAAVFDYMKHNFGLLDRKYETDETGDERLTQWQRFEKYVLSLVKDGKAGPTYKVLYVGRHGEGYHNVAEAKYGTKAWDDYWSKLDGDDDLYWVDAHLTDKGKQQAKDNSVFLKRQFEQAKMPYPARYYSSPLYRCLQTANLEYADIDQPADRPYRPLVKEMMREAMGEHTCDRRSSKSAIHNAFPDVDIEEGFSEEDELWQADHRETHPEHDVRTQRYLEDLFEHDESAFISMTSHSGSIASLLRVLGHREFRPPTGGMIPLFIKGTKKSK